MVYAFAIRCYWLLVRIAALSKAKAHLFITGRYQLLPRIQAALITEQRPRIWMHCASLGEFEQGRPVLEDLRRQYPQYALVLTFFSPSGYEVRKNYEGADYIFYLPQDTRRNAKTFLDAIQPTLAIFVKYELWYFLLDELNRRNTPTILISAIFKKGTLNSLWGRFKQRMLVHFQHLFVQDDASLKIVQQAGITTASISGDTRFDRVAAAIKDAQPLPKAATFAANHKILIAGSTWGEDEALLAKALLNLPKGWKLILVPHEVDEAHLHQIEQQFPTAIRWSSYIDGKETGVLLVDTVGLLMQLYQYGTVAWVGGGFGKAGVHNVLEPAAYSLPILHGPIYHQFLEATALVSIGGSIVCNDALTLLHWLENWEANPHAMATAGNTAKQYVTTHTGATQSIMNYLAEKAWLKRS